MIDALFDGPSLVTKRRAMFGAMVACAVVLQPHASTARRGYVFSPSFLEQRLKAGFPDHVALEQVSDTPVIYLAWGIRHFPYPARAVVEAAVDFANYPAIFRYVHRCDRIADAARRPPSLGTWYVEGRAARVRVWAIGDIDTMRWTDSSHFRFVAHQNESPRLEAQWRYRVDGWLNLRTHGVKLAAFVVASGADSCRVGVIAQGVMTKPMPQWLITLATHIVLPQLMHDLESEVARRERIRAKPAAMPPPWWKQVWRVFFGG